MSKFIIIKKAEKHELEYRRLMNGTTSLENELSVVRSRINESLEWPIRKTKLKALIKTRKSILEKVLTKNDAFVILANKTDQL